MKFIRIAGLYIFIGSVLLFIATLFMGNYKLSKTSIEKTFDGKDAKVTETFIAVAKENGVLDKTYNDQFSFTNDVKGLFDKHNEKITQAVAEEKGITSTQTQKIIDDSTQGGSISYTKDVLQKNLPEAEVTLLDNATNWMYSSKKTYDSPEAFQKDLKTKISEINKNKASEFLLYDNKYSRFNITERSATGFVTDNKYYCYS